MNTKGSSVKGWIWVLKVNGNKCKRKNERSGDKIREGKQGERTQKCNFKDIRTGTLRQKHH